MRITTEQLKAVLGSNEILKGIDFQAQDNEFVGIIGPNGSGKSTLLRCLYRVLELFIWMGRRFPPTAIRNLPNVSRWSPSTTTTTLTSLCAR